MNKKSLILAASALALVLSCNVKEDAIPLPQKVTFQAISGDNPATKTVLQSDGSVFWSPGDAINLFYGDAVSEKMVYDSTATVAAQASFTGSLPAGFAPNGTDEFWAVYPYSKDNVFDGSSVTLILPDLQPSVTGTFADDLFISIAHSTDYTLSFYNLCGGVKFCVTHPGIQYVIFRGNENEILAGQVQATFNADGKPVVLEYIKGSSEIRLNAPDSGGFEVGKWYYIVSLPASLSAGYSLLFFDKDDQLVADRLSDSAVTIKRSIWGRIADADVTAEQTVTASKYLTFTSTGSTTVSLTNEGENAPVLYCSTDAQTWTLWDYSELTFTSDAPLYLCGDNPNGFSKNSGKYSMFVSSGDLFSISGDVMSLLNRADDLQAIPCSSCFRNLFKGCTNLAEAPSLPADSLMSECYLRMFMDCSALVVAPSLPATSLTWGCYNGMFKGCSSLTATPALPASELAEYCYHEMFSGCSALTSTSTLPATVMKEGSYYMMFYGCENLLSAPELPATTLASSCYIGMFQNCTMLTSVPETLPATTLELDCYHSMFRDCHSLTKAPLLPAENLVESCYETMFYSCYSLIYVKCLATGLSGENCLKEWMTDVSSQGTFVKAANAQWPTGTSGIPEGWTVENASSASQYLTFSSRGTTTVSLTNVGNNAPVLYYSTDAQTWTQWDYSGLTFTADAPLYICGDNPQGFGTGNSSFRMSGDNVAVSGDIMSLINKDQAVTVIPSASCFYGLFYQCSALVSAPELPATTLTEYCYYNMFYGCSNLIEAPELPATTLAPWCYGQMFAACTSLVTAPNLPAETLVNACYYHMFQNSTSLEYVTCMATDISADEATTTWLEDVAATGTFVKAPNSQWPIGSSGIPQGWTVENAL